MTLCGFLNSRGGLQRVFDLASPVGGPESSGPRGVMAMPERSRESGTDARASAPALRAVLKAGLGVELLFLTA